MIGIDGVENDVLFAKAVVHPQYTVISEELTTANVDLTEHQIVLRGHNADGCQNHNQDSRTNETYDLLPRLEPTRDGTHKTCYPIDSCSHAQDENRHRTDDIANIEKLRERNDREQDKWNEEPHQ